ncbi:MAG: hypothetical protein ACR2GY_02890 [Phycisphaerales bacterium]
MIAEPYRRCGSSATGEALPMTILLDCDNETAEKLFRALDRLREEAEASNA